MKISILLNLAMLGLVGFLLSKSARPALAPPSAITAVTASQNVAQIVSVARIAPVSTPVASKPFRWDQLYGRDYHVYVKNLRAIGCPEPTLRTIVASDVHAVFRPEAAELEKKLTVLANSSWVDQIRGQTNAEAWRSELQHLPDEEAAMLADYLGEKPVAEFAELADQAGNNEQAESIVAPLVAQPVDLAALNLNEDQLQSIKDLRQEFMQKIGGPGQDANDPKYQARWRAAQLEADDLMKGMLGNQGYEDYQVQADIQAAARNASKSR